MAWYTYIGNVDPDDGTESIILVGADGVRYRVGIGQSVDLTAEQHDALGDRFIFQAGSANPARPASTQQATKKRRVPVYYYPDEGRYSTPADLPGSVPAGAVGGVLAGMLPNPGFAQPMATQSALDALRSAVPVSVALYGAEGDGVTDDTVAIQAAMDAVAADGGGTVSTPLGVYRVSGLRLPANVVLDLGGSLIKLTDGMPAGTHVIATEGFDDLVGTDGLGISGFGVRNGTIDGSKAANPNGGHGLAIFGYAYRIENVVARNCGGQGVYSEWATTSNLAYNAENEQFECFWDNVKALYNGGDGIYFDGPHDSFLTNVNAVMNGSTGMEFGPKSFGTLVTNTHSWGVQQKHAYRLNGQGVQLVNVIAEGSYDSCILVLKNDCTVDAGNVFGGWQPSAEHPAGQNKGIEIGAAGVPVAATRIDAYVHSCAQGALIFTNEAGAGDYNVTIWNGAGAAGVVGSPAVTSRMRVLANGGTSSSAPDIRPASEFTVRSKDGSDRLKLDTGGKIAYWPNGVDLRGYFDNYGSQAWRLRGELGTIETYGQVTTRKTVAGGGAIPNYSSYVAVTGSGARSITLPAASTQLGLVLTIKDEQGNAAAGNITVNRAGADTIEGATSAVINANYGFLRLMSVAGGWVRV